MTDTQFQPNSADAPTTILRGWAKAYRENPQYRFPSDPHAEFFPVDMEAAADHIDRLTERCEALEKALRGLTNCADGLSFAERDVKLAVGNTNWSVLRHWIEVGRAELAVNSQERGSK